MYKTDCCACCVHQVLRSVDPLAAMEALAVKFFSKVADNEKPPPLFVTPPFDTASFNKEIRCMTGSRKQMNFIVQVYYDTQ